MTTDAKKLANAQIVIVLTVLVKTVTAPVVKVESCTATECKSDVIAAVASQK